MTCLRTSLIQTLSFFFSELCSVLVFITKHASIPTPVFFFFVFVLLLFFKHSYLQKYSDTKVQQHATLRAVQIAYVDMVMKRTRERPQSGPFTMHYKINT